MALVAFVLSGLFGAGMLASTARADDPIVSAGPVAAPNGGTLASATVQPQGKADACVTDRNSWADASGSEQNGPAQVLNAPCESGGDSQNGGSSGSTANARQTASAGAKGGTAPAGAKSKAATQVVGAADAVGIRIANVRYDTSAVPSKKQLRVAVTLRDTHGRLVRDAIVMLDRVPRAEMTIRQCQARFSDRSGQARFVVNVRKPMLGNVLLLTVIARTPTKQAQRVGMVRLPKPASV
jgi:hypothetical protein